MGSGQSRYGWWAWPAHWPPECRAPVSFSPATPPRRDAGGAGRKDEDAGEGVGERERGSEREDEVEVGRKSRRDYPVATGAYKRIMLGRAGAEMPACKRNQFAIRYDPGNSGLAWYPHGRGERQRALSARCDPGGYLAGELGIGAHLTDTCSGVRFSRREARRRTTAHWSLSLRKSTPFRGFVRALRNNR